ncbi:ABC transporter ATP-binding protein [Chitinophaga lutea]
MRCNAGEILLVTGRSGAGKTTLLHLLAGLLRPSRGTINVAGSPIQSLSAAAMDTFRGRHIGLIFQASHFVASLSLRDNLRLPGVMSQRPTTTMRIDELAGKLGITALLHKRPSQLSQGEQQRASIARALMPHPELVLADEPTASLDDHHCAAVAALLADQAREQQTALVIVTHDSRLKDIFPQQITLT